MVADQLESPGRERPRFRRWLTSGVWVLAAVVGFVVYLQLARTRAVNSDGASQALEAWDILHGNLLMHGWTTTDVALYTTEIPEYLLVELARGLGQGVVHVGAAITYTLVVLLAAALAKGTATGREAVFRVLMAVGIMLAPQLQSGTNELLSSPDHIGTSVPVMAAWLILDRVRPRWWVPVVTTVLLAWSMIGDQLVLVIAILPLIIVCAVRLAQGAIRRRRGSRTGRADDAGSWRALWYDAALAGGAIVAALIGEVAPHVIYSLGGYYVPPVNSSLSPLHTIIHHNLPLVGDGFLLLGGAYFQGLPAGAQTWFIMLHVVGVALAACGIAVTAWRFFRGESLVPQLLLTGAVINVAAYAFGTHAAILANAREMAPVLPFAAILAGRQLPRLLSARAPVRVVAVPVLGLVLAGYVAGLGLELASPVAPPQNAQLTAWLVRHRFGTGLSGYWQANVVTLTSAEQTAIRPVNVRDGRLVRHVPNTMQSWFDPSRSSADFVVLGPDVPGYPGFTDRGAVIATFGEPARTYHVGPYTILQWHKNLLTALSR